MNDTNFLCAWLINYWDQSYYQFQFLITCSSLDNVLAPSSVILLYPRSKPTTNVLHWIVLYRVSTSCTQQKKMRNKLCSRPYEHCFHTWQKSWNLWHARAYHAGDREMWHPGHFPKHFQKNRVLVVKKHDLLVNFVIFFFISILYWINF